MRRRDLLRAMAGASGLAASGPVLSACGDERASERRLRFLYYGDAFSQEGWNQRFARFRQENSAIALTTKNVPGSNWAEFFNRVTTQMAGGQPMDVLDVATEGQLLFASKGLLEPLDPFLEQDPEFASTLRHDIHPALQKWMDKYASPDGRSYYVAVAGNPVCMWYNAEVLEQAGVPEPGPDWTWEEFYDICVRVKEIGAYGYAVSSAQFDGVMPWLLTNGVSTLDESWTEPTVTDPRAVEAATFVRRLVVEGLSPVPGGTFDAFTTAAQGRLAMFGGGRWPIITVRGLDAVDKFRILPWPQRARRGSPLGFDGFPILRISENKPDAWKLIKFLASEESMRAFAASGGTNVPANKEIALGREFMSNSPEGTEYLFQAYDYATPVPSPERGAAVQRDVEDAWEQIMVGNLTPTEGLEMLQRNLEASLGASS